MSFRKRSFCSSCLSASLRHIFRVPIESNEKMKNVNYATTPHSVHFAKSHGTLTQVNVHHAVLITRSNKTVLQNEPLVVMGTVADEGLLEFLTAVNTSDLIATGQLVEPCMNLTRRKYIAVLLYSSYNSSKTFSFSRNC